MKELFWAEPDFGLFDHARERLERALSDALSQPLAPAIASETPEEIFVTHQDPIPAPILA